MIDHVTLQVSDVAASRAFYETVLDPLGIAPGHTDGAAVGFFGPEPGSFWICPAQRPDDREVHIAFRAPSRDGVRDFHAAAVRAGADILHAPRTFPEYHDDYYAAFIRDPDGHNIEAVCHHPEARSPPPHPRPKTGASPRPTRPAAAWSSDR
jgi:catechol 2,3-dioxygenase-like lactoylglutathione lyase family enzyme